MSITNELLHDKLPMHWELRVVQTNCTTHGRVWRQPRINLMAHSRTVVPALPTILDKVHSLPEGEELCSAHLTLYIHNEHTNAKNPMLHAEPYINYNLYHEKTYFERHCQWYISQEVT